MNIIEYIKENKIIILLIIIVLLVIYFYKFPQQIEKMEDIRFNNILGKNIRLKYTKNGDAYYLGILDKSQCFNLKKTIDTVCTQNVAILQKDRTPFTSFKLVKQFNQDTYFLTSQNNAKLGHNLNLTINPSPYMCFSLGQDMNDTTFTIEKTDKGNLLVFTKKVLQVDGQVNNVLYYVAECGVTGLCKYKEDIYLKICLVTEKENAIHFEFVDNDLDVKVVESESPNASMIKTEPFDNISLGSNLSLMSQCDTMSLPGPGNDDYASWGSYNSLF